MTNAGKSIVALLISVFLIFAPDPHSNHRLLIFACKAYREKLRVGLSPDLSTALN